MHLHSDRYMYVNRLYTTAMRMLREGEPIPTDFEWALINAGINVEAMREQIDFEQNQLGFDLEEPTGSLA